MVRTLFAPRLLALHALLVVVLVSFTLLGVWQLGRFEQERRSAGSATVGSDQPVPLGSVLGVEDPVGEAAGRAVRATGVFDAEHQLLVAGREHQGEEGFLVLTPLRVEGGALLPVVRGWVPRADDPAATAPTGRVTVTGVLQPSELPDDRAPRRTVLPEGQVDVVRTAELTNLLAGERLYDGFLAQTAQEPPASPALPPMELASAGPGGAGLTNFAYALQWWVFEAFAVVMWFHFVRDALRRRAGSADRTVGTAVGDGPADQAAGSRAGA